MKTILVWLKLITKRQLKNISFLILMIAVPLLTAICSNLSSFKTENNDTVLLFCKDDDPTTSRIVNSLLENTTEYIFKMASSETELKDFVKSRKALCGFIFTKNLSKQLLKEKYNFNITCILRESNTFSDAATEQVYSKYIKEISYFLALKIIDESTGVTEENSDIDIRQLYEQIYLKDKDKFLQILFLDDTPKNHNLVSNGMLLFSVPGVMGIILLLGSLMGLGTWIMDKEKGVLVPIIRGRTLSIKLMYISVPVILLSISTLITIIFSTNIYNNDSLSLTQSLNYLKAVILYSIILILLTIVLSFFIKKLEVLIAIEVILIIGSLILCPVFFDVSGFIKPIKIIRFFMPVQWFLSLI